MVGWAAETTLDVEYAHAVAPQASILLVETPVAESEGATGFPQIAAAENYVINHGLAGVISQSFGATEQTFPSASRPASRCGRPTPTRRSTTSPCCPPRATRARPTSAWTGRPTSSTR